MHLTIALITARKAPAFEWFFASLSKQVLPTDDLGIVIVDFYAEPCDAWTALDVDDRMTRLFDVAGEHNLADETSWRPVKPNVWQGSHRFTKHNHWAVSNARNTALCYAPDGFIVWTDDRSAFVPGWMSAVREAMAEPYVVAGSYQKVAGLNVRNGIVLGSREVLGVDSRYHGQAGPVACHGDWLYGCGTGLPVEWALDIGGYDEDCDGMGFEDVIFGLMLEKAGRPIYFDPRMVVVQDRTQQWNGFVRHNYGIPPCDKSRAIMNMVLSGSRKKSRTYFGEGDIRSVRESVLSGKEFPNAAGPSFEWFTGVSMRHLDEIKTRWDV